MNLGELLFEMQVGWHIVHFIYQLIIELFN